MDNISLNYSWAIPIVKKHFLSLDLNILNIVEVGSRDAFDAIYFSLHFDCTVHAFEPDFDCIYLNKHDGELP